MLRKGFILILIALFTFACATTSDTGTTTTTSDDTNDDPNRRTKRGAAIGAVAGAIAGAVIGNQSGSNRTGAVIGAATGAAVGAAIGRRMDKQAEELRQIEGVEVTRPSEGEIAVRLKSDVLFDTDSAALRAPSRETLNDLATNFRNYPDNDLVIEGHADSTGSEAHNQRLSENRAAAVADYLIERGVSKDNMIVYGFGELRPVASNETPEGRQLNRRVEIHIRARAES